MAINNGRYVGTTGAAPVSTEPYTGYDSKKIDELLAKSNLHSNSETFSPAETFQLKADGYANIGENALSKVYGDLANNLGQYSGYANSTIGAYDNLLNFMAGNEQKIQGAAGGLYKNLVNDINQQKDYVNSVFGPNGKLTKEIDTYYDDLGNYLATDAGRQAATIAAQGVHSGASLQAIRAQQNQAYNESFGRYVQAKEQQINAKTQVATNLINFMSALRKEYGDSTNQYIIELYKRAADLYDNTAVSLGQDLNSLASLKFSASGGGGSGSSTNDLLKALGLIDGDEDGTSSDGTSIIKGEKSAGGTSDADVAAAKEKLGKELDGKKSSTNWLKIGGYILSPAVALALDATNGKLFD